MEKWEKSTSSVNYRSGKLQKTEYQDNYTLSSPASLINLQSTALQNLQGGFLGDQTVKMKSSKDFICFNR